MENSQSKAHLITAVQQLMSKYSNTHVHSYFPSYEMMMDELRDYRFYKEDMIHPNNLAISIIWEAFKKTWFSSDTELLQKEISAIQSGLKHKPFNPKSEEYLLFLKGLEAKINSVKKAIPHIHF